MQALMGGLIGAIFPALQFLSSPAALVGLGGPPARAWASGQAWNDRMLIESGKETQKAEGQAGAA